MRMRLSILLTLLGIFWGTIAKAETGEGGHPYRETQFSTYFKKPIAEQRLEPLVRPFITDDSRVVGAKLSQFESWVRSDKDAFQHWVLYAYGPTNWLELTTGFVHGVDHERTAEGLGNAYTYALPLLQAKFLFREYGDGKPPGLGLVAGTFLPGGSGSFKVPGYGAFAFSTITQCFGDEWLLLHANLGGSYLYLDPNPEAILTWGTGFQLRTYKGLHTVAEIFSGDPYIPGVGTAWQFGFRHFISDELQLDATCGQGIAGAYVLPFWWTAGVRWVFGAGK